MRLRPSALGVATAAVSVAAFVDFFLRWAPRYYEKGVDVHEVFRGWNYALEPVAALLIGAVLWEIVAAVKLVAPRATGTGRYFLATGGGVSLITAAVHVHWGNAFYGLPWRLVAYGAWIALGLGVVLIFLGFAQLRLLARPLRDWSRARTLVPSSLVVATSISGFVGFYARWTRSLEPSDITSQTKSSVATAYDVTGWDVTVGAGLFLAALAIWAVYDLVRGGAFSAVVTYLLATTAGLLVFASLLSLHWYSAPFVGGAPFAILTAWAWTELALAVVLVGTGAVRLLRYARSTRMRDAA